MCYLKEQHREKIESSIPEWVTIHPAWTRLEDQLNWYDAKSVRCQRLYKSLKFIQISLAVLIPVYSHLDVAIAKWATSIAGALIAVLEGMQHLNQYSMLWVTYRATAERLKHEKFLFLSGAGPYKEQTQEERLIALAERVEEHVSVEHANWFKESTRSGAVRKTVAA